MNCLNGEERANQLILSVQNKPRVVVSQSHQATRALMGAWSRLYAKQNGMRQVPEAAKAMLKAQQRKVRETC